MSYSFASVILPFYRQADQIQDLVKSYQVALTKLPIDFELLLIPNGPRDGTEIVSLEQASAWTNVRVVESGPGWGAAVRSGIETATGDLLCFTNSARTSAADLLLLMLYATIHPGVVVKATRRTRDNWHRRLGSLLYNLECRALFDLSNFDVNGTPKVFPRDFSGLTQLTRNDDLLDVEFNIVCRRHGYPMLEVPIISTKRVSGHSTTNYRSALKMYGGALQFWYGLRGDRFARPV